MSVLTTLRAARKLIEHEENWTTEVYARDKLGETVSFTDDQACCWCASGAVYAIDDYWDEHNDALEELRISCNECYGDRYIAAFNDNHTHAEVLALFDITIARLEKAA